MSIVVRLGGPDDVDAAVTIFVRTGNAQHPERPVPKRRIDEVARPCAAPETWFFVAEDCRPNRSGMAAAMPSREHEGAGELVPGLCYLDLIFVVPERWGDGIGVASPRHRHCDARGRAFTRIHLLTHDDNDRAQTCMPRADSSERGWVAAASDPAGMVSECPSDWARPL